MGADKAALLVEGVPSAVRIAASLADAGFPVSGLGREPIEGFGFVRDEAEHEGPAYALARFQAKSDAVFVAACDLPRFDARVVAFLGERIEGFDAAVPKARGALQPLCGLYLAGAFSVLREFVSSGERSMMGWLERLRVREVSARELRLAGIDPRAVRGANTPEEWRRLSRGGRHPGSIL